MIKVLTKRVEHLGFEFCSVLAQDLVLNFNCVAKFVKPFVFTAVIKTVCNAWPTSRRYGHNIASHCRLGCFLWQGTTSDTTPFALWWGVFVSSEGDLDVCLRFRSRSLGHLLLPHPVKFEAMVTSSFWADIICQAVNSARSSSAAVRGTGFLFSRYRTVLARVPLANRALKGLSLLD